MSGARAGSAAALSPAVPPEVEHYERAHPDPLERKPRFARQYEFRSAGSLPFSGAPEPRVLGFVRELMGEGYELTAVELEALASTNADAIRSFADTLDRRIRRAVVNIASHTVKE